MRRTVPASLQARMMSSIPSTVGLITSFCNEEPAASQTGGAMVEGKKRSSLVLGLCCKQNLGLALVFRPFSGPGPTSKYLLVYLRVFGLEVHGRGDVEDAGASLDRVVEAAFLGQVGLPDG